jgi:large subunit ribosomal protein L10
MGGEPNRVAKSQVIDTLTHCFEVAPCAIFTEYRGLKNKELMQLRRVLFPDAHYVVAKNSLARIAIRAAGIEDLGHLFEGPTAIAFGEGDPTLTARALLSYSREKPALVVKGGILDQRPLDRGDIEELARTPDRQTLYSMAAFAFRQVPAAPARAFREPLGQMARLIEQLRRTKE